VERRQLGEGRRALQGGGQLIRRAGAVAAACAAIAIPGIAAPAASAAPANIIAGGPSGEDIFNPAAYSHDAGTVATMTWLSGGSHNVTASANGPDGKPLFRSATISGGSTPVNGTQYLFQASYPFTCTIHFGMNGTLNVNAGSPLPRPEIALKFKTKSLEQALRKDEVKVKATINFNIGEEAKVDLRLGKKALGSARTTSPGVLKIKLTKKGQAALESKSKATVTASASIDFGSPAKAKATLK
jgi:plastocyanin